MIHLYERVQLLYPALYSGPVCCGCSDGHPDGCVVASGCGLVCRSCIMTLCPYSLSWAFLSIGEVFSTPWATFELSLLAIEWQEFCMCSGDEPFNYLAYYLQQFSSTVKVVSLLCPSFHAQVFLNFMKSNLPSLALCFGCKIKKWPYPMT